MSAATPTETAGAPPTHEQLQHAFAEAHGRYTMALGAAIQQNGGQINPLLLVVELDILRMRFDTLLAAMVHMQASGEPFSMARYDAAVISNLQRMVESLQQPRIVVAGAALRT